MDSALQTLAVNQGISNTDVTVIDDLVNAFPKNSVLANRHLLERMFSKDIKAGHYLCLGLLMGVSIATRETLSQIYKSLEPCQRVN